MAVADGFVNYGPPQRSLMVTTRQTWKDSCPAGAMVTAPSQGGSPICVDSRCGVMSQDLWLSSLSQVPPCFSPPFRQCLGCYSYALGRSVSHVRVQNSVCSLPQCSSLSSW